LEATVRPREDGLKRTRWLWLKNPWNLKPEQKRRLSQLCRKNQPIVRAYYLKEASQRFWDYLSEGWARPYLKQWLWWDRPSGEMACLMEDASPSGPPTAGSNPLRGSPA